MIEPEKRKAIYYLHEEGMKIRDISRSLGISRNTVRGIIKQKGRMPVSERRDRIKIDPGHLIELSLYL